MSSFTVAYLNGCPRVLKIFRANAREAKMKLTQCANGCGVILPAPKKGEPKPVCGACQKNPERGREAAEREAQREALFGPIKPERNYD